MHAGLIGSGSVGLPAADALLWTTPIRDRLTLNTGGGPAMIMMHYRIYELDSLDQILDGYSIVCRSDAAVIVAACQIEERAVAVEVWEHARRVARLLPRKQRLRKVLNEPP
jgi:hypothetical protein